MNITKNLLIDVAKLCFISYKSENEVKEKYGCKPILNENFNNVFYSCSLPKLYSRDNDSQMYTCQNKDFLCITFRGTESMRDILTDLNILRTELPLYGIAPENYPKIHQGFYNQYKHLEQDIDEEIKNYMENKDRNKERNKEKDKNNEKEVNIIFSGHSLGGALATISSLTYSLKYPNLNIACITFGSPRVGDKSFATYFNNIVKESYRFVNDNDPVPCIPIAWRFELVKGCIWLYEDKVLNEIKVWRSWRFFKNCFLSLFGYGYNASKDHSCEEYCKDLKYY